jgi:hypothetical protein
MRIMRVIDPDGQLHIIDFAHDEFLRAPQLTAVAEARAERDQAQAAAKEACARNQVLLSRVMSVATTVRSENQSASNIQEAHETRQHPVPPPRGAASHHEVRRPPVRRPGGADTVLVDDERLLAGLLVGFAGDVLVLAPRTTTASRPGVGGGAARAVRPCSGRANRGNCGGRDRLDGWLMEGVRAMATG